MGAYTENEDCIGLAIYQKSCNKYLYLYDLKVNAKYRHNGIGKKLIEEMKETGAVLEFQLTSNVRLNNLTDLSSHPKKRY